MRRAQNIFILKDINCITIIITLEGIEKIKSKKKQRKKKQSKDYFFHQNCKAPFLWRKVVPGNKDKPSQPRRAFIGEKSGPLFPSQELAVQALIVPP